jgi:deoxyhypusine synthase
MNTNVKDELKMLQDYIENLESKNEKDLLNDENAKKLTEAGNILRELDVSIVGDLKEEIIKSIDKTANSVISKFTAKQDKDKKYEEIKDIFFSSEDYKTFRKNTIDMVAKHMNENKISKETFDMILSSFNITLSQDEMNQIVSETIPEKPKTVLENGMQYVWDAEKKAWMIVKK